MWMSRKTAYAPKGLSKTALTRSGVKGTLRSRAPVASNTALAMATGMAQGAGSPAASVG